MLNVPDRIKELLHTDSVNKNIRIHFPNGERSDICNDLIVKDTVEFKESLCSQNKIKFGLCESSIFQCEVVGVGNVTGAVIEVYCEILCESTVEGAVWQSDIEHWVYQIPYGVFTIQTAKRQADMQHRQIVAYTSTSDTFKPRLSNEEVAKHRVPLSSNIAYTPNLVYFSYVNGFRYSDDIFTVNDVPSVQSGGSSFWTSFEGFSVYITFSNWKRWIIGRANDTNYENPNSLYTLKGNTAKLNTFISDFAAGMERTFGIEKEKIIDFLMEELGVVSRWRNGLDAFNYVTGVPTNMPILFYPYINGWFSNSENKYFEIEATGGEIYISFTKDGAGYYAQRKDVGFDYTVEKRAVSNALQNINLNFIRYYSNVGLQYQRGWLIKFNPNKEEAKTYDAFSAEMLFDYNNAFLEMNGCFGKISRYDSIKIITLQRQFNLTPEIDLFPSADLTPESVTGGKLLPEDYQSCWYDNNYSKPFGAVQCSYTNTSDESCVFTLFLSGFDSNSNINSYKTYEFGQNNSLINKRKWTQEKIKAMCNIIAANISGVAYIPVEFIGRGLPYVEAGDTFEILTKSNDSITTIVLNRTIKGEQHLVDSYKSV